MAGQLHSEEHIRAMCTRLSRWVFPLPQQQFSLGLRLLTSPLRLRLSSSSNNRSTTGPWRRSSSGRRPATHRAWRFFRRRRWCPWRLWRI
jgi:hypothetical protein